METVTVSKQKYQTLQRRAALYEKVFKVKEVTVFPVESYTAARLREFLGADHVSAAARRKAARLPKKHAR